MSLDTEAFAELIGSDNLSRWEIETQEPGDLPDPAVPPPVDGHPSPELASLYAPRPAHDLAGDHWPLRVFQKGLFQT